MTDWCDPAADDLALIVLEGDEDRALASALEKVRSCECSEDYNDKNCYWKASSEEQKKREFTAVSNLIYDVLDKYAARFRFESP